MTTDYQHWYLSLKVIHSRWEEWHSKDKDSDAKATSWINITAQSLGRRRRSRRRKKKKTGIKESDFPPQSIFKLLQHIPLIYESLSFCTDVSLNGCKKQHSWTLVSSTQWLQYKDQGYKNQEVMNGAVCQAVHSEYNGAVTVCQVGMSKLAPVQRAFNTEAAQSGYYDWPCNSTQEAAHGPTCLLKIHPEN